MSKKNHFFRLIAPLTIETCVRGRKIELADFPEQLEGGVEEMVVRFVFSLDLSFQFFFCFLEFN